MSPSFEMEPTVPEENGADTSKNGLPLSKADNRLIKRKETMKPDII